MIYEVEGYYANQQVCTILVYESDSTNKWYCIDGFREIYCTYEDIILGINIKNILDIDIIETDEPVNSLEMLKDIVDDQVKSHEDKLNPPFTSLRIDINDVMLTNQRGEVVKMLEKFIDTINEHGVLNTDGMYLKDSNGNTVGTVTFY